MNKTRRKKARRATRLSRLNQAKFGNNQGIKIYELTFRCRDCEEGVETHNPFHFPHTRYDFSFNTDTSEDVEYFISTGEYSSVSLIEHWTPREIRKGLNGLFDTEDSWTRLAIARCNELER